MLIGIAIFVASYTLQVISLALDKKLMETITKPFIVAGIILSAVMILIHRLPDSRNVLIFTCIALGAALLGDILLLKPENPKRLVSGGGFFLISNLTWILIMLPSLKLYTIPVWTTVLIILAYILCFLCYYFFFLKKQKLLVTLGLIAYGSVLLFLHYLTVVTFAGTFKLHSILMGSGVVCLLISDGILSREFVGNPLKKNQLLVMIFYGLSELLMAGATVIMSCF